MLRVNQETSKGEKEKEVKKKSRMSPPENPSTCWGRFQRASERNAILVVERQVSAEQLENDIDADGGMLPAKKSKIKQQGISQEGDAEVVLRQARQYGSPKAYRRPLESVSYTSPKQRGEMAFATGETPGGTKMQANRQYDFLYNGQSMSALIFSPEKASQVEETTRPLSSFSRSLLDAYDNDPLPSDHSASTEEEESSIEISQQIAGLYETELTSSQSTLSQEDLAARSQLSRQRAPSQRQVMKESAKISIARLIADLKDKGMPLALIQRMEQLDREQMWEWLHGVAWSLTPPAENPQVPQNLSAASRDENTYMMVIESLAKRMLKALPDLKAHYSVDTLRTKAHKIMLEMKQSIRFSHEGQEVILTRTGSPLDCPEPPKARDSHLLGDLATAMLLQEAPQRTFLAMHAAHQRSEQRLTFSQAKLLQHAQVTTHLTKKKAGF